MFLAYRSESRNGLALIKLISKHSQERHTEKTQPFALSIPIPKAIFATGQIVPCEWQLLGGHLQLPL